VTLFEVLVESAEETPDAVRADAPDGSITWSVDGRPFAVLSADGSMASFLLESMVAAAAVRTPDVRPSPRGPAWVELQPADVDEHAADRANAWFIFAHGRLTTGR
jgi:hypothetical protein